jgi:hypothetical protein
MNKKEDLFLLIASLSRTEKRYFKLFAAKNGSKEAKYSIVLFNILEKQASSTGDKKDKYDESIVVKKLKGNPLLKRFSSAKVELYQLILKSLHRYHSDISITVKEHIHFIKILFDRGLLHQCYEAIKKTKAKATKYELFELLLEIHDIERNVTHQLWSQSNVLMHKTEKIRKEEELSLLRIGRIRHFKSIGAKFLSVTNKSNAIRNTESQKTFRKLITDPLFSEKKKATCFSEMYFMYKAFEFFYSKNEDHPNSYLITKKIIGLVIDSPNQTAINPLRFLAAYNNHILNCRRTKKYDEMMEGIHVMRSFADKLKPTFSNIQILTFQSTYLLELKMYEDIGEFKNAIQLISIINDKLNAHGNKIAELYKIFFYLNFSMVYFGAGDYKNALQWINVGLNYPDIKSYEDSRRVFLFINLMVHYELGNYDHLQGLMRSMQRGSKLNMYEIRLLKLFNVLSAEHLGSNHRKNILTLFTSAKKDLIRIKKEKPLVTSDPPDIDIISWLDSKIENRSFADIIKRKAKQVT